MVEPASTVARNLDENEELKMNDNKLLEQAKTLIDQAEVLVKQAQTEADVSDLEMAEAITPKKRGRPEKVSKEVFAEVWNQCNSLREVAEVLGVPPMSASVKASNMRKTGCQLKLYKRGAKRKLSCAS